MTPEHKKNVRVRFAPSPTGPLNIGGARTAFFCWLFAKQNSGAFILRIEDTDFARSSPEYEENIKEGLIWLGLEWDEFYRQSDRLELYERYLSKLIKENFAYYCFCSPEELESEEEARLSQGLSPKYGGKCRMIPINEAERRSKTERHVIRIKTPEKEASFHDAVRGKVSFDIALMGDFIIAKGAGNPLFNFSNVVDDYEMNITHVVRGEDHISNTPRQLVIQEALGFPPLEYAHLPLILGPDKKKLSKRDLAKSVIDYRNEGYLVQAILNFIALLGWHPEEDREVFSVSDMMEEFSFSRVQKSGGVFNPTKLDWLGRHYIKKLSAEKLAEHLEPFVPKAWTADKDRFLRTADAFKERLKKLSDFKTLAGFVFELGDYEPGLLAWRKSTKESAAINLEEILPIFNSMPESDFKKETIESKMMLIAKMRGNGEVLWPLRVALSGKESSPGPFELAEMLGKEETLRRISLAIRILAGSVRSTSSGLASSPQT